MNEYTDALKKAQQELANCDAAADELERKRASLRQTIIGLQMLTGVKAEEPPRSLKVTEAIRRLVLTDDSGFITAAEVARRLAQLGYEVHSRSLSTILCRLAKVGKIAHIAGPNHTAAYGPKATHDPAEGQPSYGKRAAVIGRIRRRRKETA